MKKVLFLCTGNSCRSQIAEAFVTQKTEGWEAYSAGTEPAGYVHPKALQVLEEVGINHSGRSKHVNELREIDFDLVVTVCDSAAEGCPLWLGKGKQVHSSFSDPAKASGSEEEILSEFRRVRDEIINNIPALLENQEFSTET
jgi:arsenate reductase (thioredoxin)